MLRAQSREAHARPVCAASGSILFSLPSSCRGFHSKAAALFSGGWILRIFSPNPPTQPSVGSWPRTPTTGDAPCFHVLSAAQEVWGREVARVAGAWSGVKASLGRAGRSRRCGIRAERGLPERHPPFGWVGVTCLPIARVSFSRTEVLCHLSLTSARCFSAEKMGE